MISREEIVNAIQDLFIIRNDAYAVQQADSRYFTETNMLSASEINKHLDGQKTIGTYTLSKENKCKWVCYDFDGTDLNAEKDKAIKLSTYLTSKGYNNIVEFSGKKGYHVWVFFKETDGYSAYEFGRSVCNGHEVHEIFPKQYELSGKEFGNLVKLPLGIHKVVNKRSTFLHPITFEPMDFETSMDYIYTFSKNERLVIPTYIKQTIEPNKNMSKLTEKEELSETTKYIINNGASEGSRHKKEWFITVDLYLSGWDEKDIIEQVLIFNKNCTPPKDERLVINHITNVLNNPKEYIEKYGFIKDKSIESALKWIMKKEGERTERNKEANKEVIGFDARLFNYSIALAFVKNLNFIALKDTGELMWYNKDSGIYENNGTEIIDALCGMHLNKYKTTNLMREVLALVKSKTYIDRDDLNADKHLFALENGIFNIRTMELTEFSPNILITIKIPVKYDAKQDCPMFKKFINEIIDERDTLNVQEFFGYCLHRDYNIHKSFMLYGSGSNGKSTLINVLRSLLGDKNITSIALQDFDNDKFASSYLYGKLANTYADLPDIALYNTGKFKMLTGNDMVSGQQKFRPAFNFTSYAKMIFSCNKIPKSHDDTDAFWRRWIIIMFNRSFEGKEKDSNLLGKLTTQEELAGIFNWSIEGLKRLLENGDFSNYESLKEMRDLYIRKSDPVHTFVMDNVVQDDSAEIIKDELFSEYKKYAQQHKLPRMTAQKFGMELKSINEISLEQQRSTKDPKRRWAWIGIRLKTSQDNEEIIDE